MRMRINLAKFFSSTFCITIPLLPSLSLSSCFTPLPRSLPPALSLPRRPSLFLSFFLSFFLSYFLLCVHTCPCIHTSARTKHTRTHANTREHTRTHANTRERTRTHVYNIEASNRIRWEPSPAYG
jgi:hypothetical protein